MWRGALGTWTASTRWKDETLTFMRARKNLGITVPSALQFLARVVEEKTF